LVLFLLELFLLLLVFLVLLGVPSVRGSGTICRRKISGMDCSGGASGVVLWANGVALWASSVVLRTRG
jgi:hypothetical protein